MLEQPQKQKANERKSDHKVETRVKNLFLTSFFSLKGTCFFCLFIFGCIESLLLRSGFL